MEHLLWTELFRPQSIADCILPSRIKDKLSKIATGEQIPPLLLSGPPGCGKTTAARALCKDVGISNPLFINGSKDNGIDFLRNEVEQYASTKSIFDEPRLVIYDEADHLSAHTQPALKGFIEQYAGLCSFIFTCNEPHRIIEPIHSRCVVIDFHYTKDETKELIKKFYTRIEKLLTDSQVKFKKECLLRHIMNYAPDFRKSIAELQMYAVQNDRVIDEGILASSGKKNNYSTLIELLAVRNYDGVYEWSYQNYDGDPLVFGKVVRELKTKVNKGIHSQVAISLGDWQDKFSRSADKSLCVLAAMVDVMSLLPAKE